MERWRLLSGLFPVYITSILNNVWHKAVTPYMFVEWKKMLINAWASSRTTNVSALFPPIFPKHVEKFPEKGVLSSNKFGKCLVKLNNFLCYKSFQISRFPICMTSEPTSSDISGGQLGSWYYLTTIATILLHIHYISYFGYG